MSDPSLTPMMHQYRELKARDPDALLLFRMGDFYEMFGEDAERGAALLGLALTTRDKGPNAVPMAGFPHPALESYLAKLVQAGQRAAVCEQVEDPKLAKGLVKREVVRVVTPGTLTDEALLDPKTAELSGRRRRGRWQARSGLGRAFDRAVLADRRLADRTGRRDRPAQPGGDAGLRDCSLDAPWVRALRGRIGGLAVTSRPSWDFQPEQARKRSSSTSGRRRWTGSASTTTPPRSRPPGALVAYLRETQKSSLGHITRLTPYRTRRDAGTRRDDPPQPGADADPPRRQARRLAAPVIDRTGTPMGARLLADWLTSPLTRPEPIAERHDAVAELVTRLGLARRPARRPGRGLRPGAAGGAGRHRPSHAARPRRTGAHAGPAAEDQGPARPPGGRSGSIELEAALELCPEVRAVDRGRARRRPAAGPQGRGPDPRRAIIPNSTSSARSPRAARPGSPRYQAEQVRRTGHQQPQGRLQQGLRLLHRDHPRTGARRFPPDYIRKQTVKNAERYITPELKEYEDKVLRAEDRACELEYELFIDPARPRRGRGAAADPGGRGAGAGRRPRRRSPSWPCGKATAAPRSSPSRSSRSRPAGIRSSTS